MIIWLLQCWNNSLELEGRETKHLGSLSRERDIPKVAAKQTSPKLLKVISVKHEGRLPLQGMGCMSPKQVGPPWREVSST